MHRFTDVFVLAQHALIIFFDVKLYIIAFIKGPK